MSRRLAVVTWEPEPEVTHENQDCSEYGELVFHLLHHETPEEQQYATELVEKLTARKFRGWGLAIVYMPVALEAYRALCTTHNIAPEAGR